MISGKMYHHEEEDSLENKIQFLIRYHKITDFDCILVNNKLLNKEKTINNVKIKPDPLVLPDHF